MGSKKTVAARDSIVERLRAICMALPEANERVSHGEPTWFAGKGKVFAMLDDHHHGALHLSVWLPMVPGAREDLVASDPARYFRPPYLGSRGWVGVVLDTRPDWAFVAELMRDAFLHVATKKLQKQLLGAPPAEEAAPRPPSLAAPNRRKMASSTLP